MEHLSSTVVDSDLVKFFVDLGTTGVKAIDGLVNALTPLGTVGLGAGIFAGIKNIGIFKTINSSVDETRKTLALFNKDWNTYKTNWQQGFSQNGFAGGVKSIFQSSSQNSVISKDQVQILRNWNNAVAHGCTNQETFNRIIANADDNIKMYFAGLNKGKGSIEGLENAQNVAKQSTIGLTIAQTALNMAISMGLMAAISLAIKGFDKLVNSAKRASEAADEAFSDTNEKVQQNEEEAKSLDELISKYKELKESGNLDIDGRKEVKELQNDIADLVGTQAKNLDLVNGRLDDEIKKLDEISAKEAKNAYETATANYNNSKKAKEKATGDESFLFVDGYAYTGKREKEAEEVLKNAGFGNNVQSGGFFGNTLFVMDSFDNNMKELKGAQEKADYLQSMIDVLEQNGQRATDLYAGLIKQRDAYLKYIDNQQNAANSLVNSWITYSQFSNEELSKINVDSVESFDTYRQKMIEEAKNDESIGKILDDGTLSNEDLEKSVNDFMATSLNFSKWYEQWLGNVQGSTSNDKTDILSFSEAWEQLKNSADDATKGLADDLIELAESGKLTSEALSEADTSEFFKNAGISAEEATRQINALVSSSTQLNALSEQISKMSDMLADKKNGTVASASDLAGFDAEVRGLDSWKEFESVMGSTTSTIEECQDAANALATEWVNDGNFLSNLTDENKAYYETQLDQMGIANAQEVITDALARKHEEEAIEEEYAAAASQYNAQCKDGLNAVSANLTEVTAGEITRLQQEGIISADTAEKISVLAVKKAIANGTTLDTSGDIRNLANLAGAATQLGRLLESLAKIKQGFTNGMPSDVVAKQAESYQKQIEAYLTGGSNKNIGANINLNVNPKGSIKYKPSGGSGGSRSSGGSGGSGGKKSKTEIDWIERKITILNNKIDAFATKANDTWSSWTSRTKALNSEMETTKKLLTSVYGISSKTQKKLNSQRDSAKNKLDKYVKKNSKVLTSSTIKKIKSGKLDTSKLSKKDKKVVEEYKKLQKDYNKKDSKAKKASEKNPAADYYFAKANKVAKKYKLSPAIIKKIKNGTISISDYNESMANAIQKYQDYYDKGKDAQKSKKETKQKLNELAEEQVSYIQTRYENKLSNVDYTSNKAQAKLDFAETTGHYATQKYYKQLIESANESINLNNQEADELIAKRDALVKDGALKKGSEAWYDMSKEIWKCKNNVLELTNSVAEYNNSLRDLEWDAFDRQEEYIERIIDEANFLIDIIGSKEKFDENGNITSYGKSAEGLHAINANTYQQLANDKADEIARLDAEYVNDKYNKDYLERREELLEAHREAIKGYQSERSAIVNLVSDGYNAMSEALDKLIDKRKEALSSEKNLYDYQKSITEKTKSLAKLRKQLDAIQGDNSEETKAQIQKIKVSIEDAQSDLQDAEYNQWMSDQEELMDKVSDDFKDWIDNRLKNTDDIVKDVIKQTNLSASEIKSTLEIVTNENGTKLTTEMSNIFDTANGISETVSDIWNGSDGVKTKLGDVIEGIKSVVEAINKKAVDESVFNTSGSSGSDNKNSSTSNNGSTSNNKTSTTTTNKTSSSTSSSSSSKTETNAKWAAKYLKKKKFTGDKSKLNKNGSIVDRLKYFDFDSSESARSKFYKGLYKATYTGSAAQNTKLIAEMKKHGFRNGGEIGDLIRLTGEDGFILARQGEGVLSQENMDKIREAVNMSNITLSMMSNFSKIPQVKSSNMNNINQSVNIGDIQVVANNPQEFAQQLRDTVSSDTKTQKMFSAFIGNQMLGKNSLDFKKYR